MRWSVTVSPEYRRVDGMGAIFVWLLCSGLPAFAGAAPTRLSSERTEDTLRSLTSLRQGKYPLYWHKTKLRGKTPLRIICELPKVEVNVGIS